jgi:arsenical pump membrane protein
MVWILAVVAAAVTLATGWLPWHDADLLGHRAVPVLAFLIGITVVAELADDAQLFQVTARGAARLGKGNTRRLFCWIVGLGTLTTVILSLDTTAVLLTPVVLTTAQELEIDPLPFAIAAVWLANTASLLLPVSNLTNLLGVRTLHLSALGFAGRMAVPELVSVVLTLVLLAVLYRRRLRGSYLQPVAAPVADSVLLWTSGAVCLAFVPLFVVGIPVQWPALGGAVVLALMFGWRRRSRLRIDLVPWQTVLFVAGLFVVVQACSLHFLHDWLSHAVGTSHGAVGDLRTAGVGAAASNAVNNLPAYLAIEPVAEQSRQQLLSLILGTNIGPLVTVWGSLATILWRQRCRARGVCVSARHFAAIGLVGASTLLVATWAALMVTG